MQEAGRERNPSVDPMVLVAALIDPIVRQARGSWRWAARRADQRSA
jgi:hypothetical protein